ncbi:hypothetical protein V6R21_10285 [Limibacter armeniacum]|uniref:hypothetical protein n=1 Tax=Limibacter armeniacum TaxID=466084 RepID=UPI002FE6349C
MRKIGLIFTIVISILVLRINFKLHSENHSLSETKKDILLQLDFLETELKEKNLGVRMQRIFPEGFVFVNALYGLAWCELAIADSEDKVLKQKAISEAIYAFDNIDSDQAKWTFPNHLPLEYGVFYNGWRNYLLSKIFCVDKEFENHKYYLKKFLQQSDLIENAISSSQTPYLESYRGQSWPADSYVAMASLANYSRTFGTRYDKMISLWLENVTERLDAKTGMIPHKTNSKTGISTQGARGCSMILMLRMLGEIDTKIAREQYGLFSNNFITEILGLPVIREYPKGQTGFGDIDSGPVIFGVGFSATIVGIGTFAMFDQYDLSQRQYKTVHSFGLDRKTKKNKKYLLGTLPMADAFIAWGRATELNFRPDSNKSNRKLWRFKFHAISGLIVIVLWTIYYRRWIWRHIKTTINTRS